MVETERRQNTRVPFRAKVDVDFRDRRYEGCQVLDLSIKGIRLQGAGEGRPGEVCQLTLCLSGTSSELCLHMQGEVVRTPGQQGLAVHFTAVDLDSFYHLKNIVYYNADDPDGIREQLVE